MPKSMSVTPPFQDHMVRYDLPKVLNTIKPELIAETRECVYNYLSTAHRNWTTVNIFDKVLRIIARTANRVIIDDAVGKCTTDRFKSENQ